MERFREHEKEFKMKQYSKRALAASLEHMGNFVQGDDDSDNSHSYGIEDSDENKSNDSNFEFEEDEYLACFFWLLLKGLFDPTDMMAVVCFMFGLWYAVCGLFEPYCFFFC